MPVFSTPGSPNRMSKVSLWKQKEEYGTPKFGEEIGEENFEIFLTKPPSFQ